MSAFLQVNSVCSVPDAECAPSFILNMEPYPWERGCLGGNMWLLSCLTTCQPQKMAWHLSESLSKWEPSGLPSAKDRRKIKCNVRLPCIDRYRERLMLVDFLCSLQSLPGNLIQNFLASFALGAELETSEKSVKVAGPDLYHPWCPFVLPLSYHGEPFVPHHSP